MTPRTTLAITLLGGRRPLSPPKPASPRLCAAAAAGVIALVLGGCAHGATPTPVNSSPATPAKPTAGPIPPAPRPPAPASAAPTAQVSRPARVKASPETASVAGRVTRANAAARVQPNREGFVNAVQVYPFADGSLFQVYAAPGEITDIALEPGEQLVGTGPVAAGDTVRWIIGDTESGSGPTRKVHILVKPTRSALTTNLIINTDRRTYLLELRSTERTYMAQVSWRYPADELIALHKQQNEAEAAEPIAAGVDVSALDFRYAIEGDRPPWRPVRAFDDGQKVYIEFPAGIAQGDLPPLFVVGPHGSAELVNYRVKGDYYVVDRLFAAAELRLGDKASAQRVRIVRTDKAPRS